ncbi:ROK family protein [Granulicella arctica]|uniref:ROK family protein n=1 Tax=Granulicella arctica TaxID=940613 RepID=UPI0021E0E51B|nr:ROK family transcriptional regulator [Granulicella arctica]
MARSSIPVGRPSVLRHANALHVLRLLRECRACSRADLVRSSSLSAPTITNVVNDLLSANLIEPLGGGESSGGRPPDMIRFKAERGCALAIDITASFISLLLTDLDGEEIILDSISLLGRRTTPAAICSLISTKVNALLRRENKKTGDVLVAVVGVPSITNVDEGIVLSISTLENWRSVPLGKMLTKALRCRVIIENDTNLAALGERYKGAAQGEENFILISIGPSMGSGIILNGELHHGSQWSAGEIGYLRLPNVSKSYPAIHSFGELETLVSEQGIVESWERATRRRLSQKTVRALDAVAIFELAAGGDAQAKKVIQARAGMVADIIVNISLILNPGLILLGGTLGSHPLLLKLVRERLRESEFGIMKIGQSVLGSSATLWGGVALALEVIPSVLLPKPVH